MQADPDDAPEATPEAGTATAPAPSDPPVCVRPLDEALPRGTRRADVPELVALALALLAWPLSALLVGESTPGRAPVTSAVWLLCGGLLAASLALAGAPLAGAERRHPRLGVRSQRRRVVLSAVLALPALSLCATLPLVLPGLGALPVLCVVALVVSALGASWLLWGTIRGAFGALRGRPARATEARWLHRCARALDARLAGDGSRQVASYVLRLRGERELHLETRIAPLHEVRLYRGAAVVEAARGHLPRALEAQLREALGSTGVRLVPSDGRAGEQARVVLTGKRAAAVGEAVARVVAAWSTRERLAGAEQDTGAQAAAPLAGRARAATAAVQVHGWLRAVSAAALVGVLVAGLASVLVVFPVWEGSGWWVGALFGAALCAALLHALPGARPSQVGDVVLGAALREVLDLLWASGVSAGDATIEEEEPGTAGTRTLRTLRIDSGVLQARLSLWSTGSDAGGARLGERLELRVRDESGVGAMGLRRVRDALEALGWPHEASATAVVMATRRTVGSGRGAWRELAWRVGEEAVLLEGEVPSAGLVDSARVPEAALLASARRPLRVLRPLLASVALAAVVLALPRVGADQFEVARGGDEAALVAQARAASACPPAGASPYEELRALRCLANAAGQGERRLEALDWSALLEPIAAAMSAMTEIASLGATASCSEVAQRASSFGSQGTLERAIAWLERYRAETWGELHFFWPTRLVRDGRQLSWPALEQALERCQGDVDAEVIAQARRLYGLSREAFAQLYGGSGR